MITKNYKYNEFEYAELIYSKGFQTKFIATELRLLVLYYKDVLGLKPKERTEKIYEFCEKYMPDYKRAKYFKAINKALRQGGAKGQKLVTVKQVDIYKDELDYISSLEIDYNFKKILFTFLVHMKLNKIIYEYKNEDLYTSKYFKGGSVKYNNIKKMANLDNNININDDVIYFLDQYDLIKILHKGLIVLNYLDNCCETGEIVIEVEDYENVGWTLDYYNKIKGIKLCESCDNIFKQSNNKQKYCKSCAKSVKNQKNLEYYHKN